MGAGHDHSGQQPTPVDATTRKLLAGAVIICAIIAAIAAVLTWPSDENENTFNLGADLYTGTVERVFECPPADVPQGAEDLECVVVQVEITEGVDAGQLFELPPFFEPRTTFEAGDQLILARIDEPSAPFRYAFSDRNRTSALFLLAFVFALAVVLLGGLRGASALVGLASTAAVLGFYTLPALLEGQSALPIACVTAAIIAVVALYTSHGFHTMTTVAVLGTLLTLGLTVGLGVVFIELTELSGFATEESLFIQGVGDIDVRGLLLAGLVIGALGALDDMTVTQASVVFELRRADPTATRRHIFTSAMRVGRDHVASTVNTLFLAYAGASLPLLLLFSVGQLPVTDVANSELVATEIVRTLVGSIGLVASVPLTTWLAVSVVGDGNMAPTVPSGQRPPKRRGPATHTLPDTITSEEGTGTDADQPLMQPTSEVDPGRPDASTPRPSRWSNLREGIDD